MPADTQPKAVTRSPESRGSERGATTRASLLAAARRAFTTGGSEPANDAVAVA